ncbi:RlpA-like double-psi beta-barrel-protein domain-containing protein-containing protein, partial [Dimargaris cristalligena]
SQFQGDGTFYNPGVGTGSCGQLHQDSELVVALNKQQYGDMANPNLAEVCGKQVEIKGPKGSVRATIVDTCPVVGCGYGSLDLSPAAFEKIADFDTGRVPIQWSF